MKSLLFLSEHEVNRLGLPCDYLPFHLEEGGPGRKRVPPGARHWGLGRVIQRAERFQLNIDISPFCILPFP